MRSMDNTIFVFGATSSLIADVTDFFSVSGGSTRLTVTRPQTKEARDVPVPFMRDKPGVVRESCGTCVLERKFQGTAPGRGDGFVIRNSDTRVITKSESFASELWSVLANLPYSPVIRIRGESGAGKSHVARLLYSARCDAQSLPRQVQGMCLSKVRLASDALEAVSASANDRSSAVGLLETAFGKDVSELIVDDPQMLPRWMLRAMYDAANEQSRIKVTFCVTPTGATPSPAPNVDLFNEMTSYCPEVFVPALRTRPADIIPLFLDLCMEMQQTVRRGSLSIDGNWLEEMKHHQWPGNIRELKELARRFVLLAPTSGFRRHEFRNF